MRGARLLQDVLTEYERNQGIEKSSFDKLNGIDKKLVERYLKQIDDEQRKIKDLFQEAQGLPREQRKKLIIERLHLAENLEGLEPEFIEHEHTIVLLLNEKDYKKMNQDISTGLFFTADDIPIIVLMTKDSLSAKTDKSEGLNLAELYGDLLGEAVHDIMNGKITGTEREELFEIGNFPEKYKHFIKSLDDNSADSITNDIYDEIVDATFDALETIQPYQLWYATNILQICSNEQEISDQLGIPPIITHQVDLALLQDELQSTIFHEFYHSISRFLPVHAATRNEGDIKTITKEQEVKIWLSRFAEEVVIYSFHEGLADRAFYKTHYNKPIIFDDAAKKNLLTQNSSDNHK
jgi:hypothetical protein